MMWFRLENALLRFQRFLPQPLIERWRKRPKTASATEECYSAHYDKMCRCPSNKDEELAYAINIITKWCLRNPCVIRAWIFGSRVLFTNHEESDIDIAIEVISRFHNESPTSVMFFEREHWARSLSVSLPWKVDLCRYEPCEDSSGDHEGLRIIRQAVEEHGILVFDKDQPELCKPNCNILHGWSGLTLKGI